MPANVAAILVSLGTGCSSQVCLLSVWESADRCHATLILLTLCVKCPDPGCRSWLSGASDEEGSGSEGRVPSPPSSDAEATSLLDTVLLAEWEDRAEQGLFRYDVTACPTKVVPGAYGFVAQFNEGRGSKKRPTEFRVDKVPRSHPQRCPASSLRDNLYS